MRIAEVVEFPNSSRRDVPTELRRLADEIEAGTYGGVGSAVLVILANTVKSMTLVR